MHWHDKFHDRETSSLKYFHSLTIKLNAARRYLDVCMMCLFMNRNFMDACKTVRKHFKNLNNNSER